MSSCNTDEPDHALKATDFIFYSPLWFQSYYPSVAILSESTKQKLLSSQSRCLRLPLASSSQTTIAHRVFQADVHSCSMPASISDLERFSRTSNRVEVLSYTNRSEFGHDICTSDTLYKHQSG